jgi:hypothetical protein
MNKHMLLVASLLVAMVAAVQPAFADKKESAPGPAVDESKLDNAPKSDQKKSDEKTKKPSRTVVKILPLKSSKEMAK